jgi:hypothetical protein
MEKNTAEKRVVTREAKTWKSRVNAIIRRVHSHFASSRLEAPLTWPADNGIGRTHKPRRGSAAGELIVKLLKQSLSLLLSGCLVLVTALQEVVPS